MSTTDDETVEAMAVAMDPDIWAADLPVGTRSATVAFHERRGASIARARAALAAVREMDAAERRLDEMANEMSADAEACLTGEIRSYADKVTGGNCTFADDDLRILAHLAQRAADADLIDGLHPDIQAKMRAKRLPPPPGGE